MMMACVIGIDGGTEGLRAHVFDLIGRPLGAASVAYGTDFPAPGRAEQDPEDWWLACGAAVRKALSEAGVGPWGVEALACDTTSCSVVALDEAGRPLRPALIWMDVRAHQEAADLLATGDPALRVNGAGRGPVSPEWMIPKALWLSRHEPHLWAQAARIGEYQDFLTHRLTGRWAASRNNQTMRWHFQSDHGGAPDSLVAAAGIPEITERWPKEVVAPGEFLGPLIPSAADHLGLRPGTPVVQGGADAFIAMVGLGVTEPGDLALITGSSHLHLGIASGEVYAPGIWGSYKDCVYPGKYVIEGGQTSTGSVIAWFKRHFAEGMSYEALNAAAADLPPGAEGLLAVDHFQGNRTPHTDALARGAITGLSLKHTPAHVYRALIESVCLGTRTIVENFGDAFHPRRIVACGGTTRSPFWLQIHADTLGLPLELPEVTDAAALGSAILAAVGVGRFGSIEEGTRAMVRISRTVEPDRAAHAAYAPIHARYKAAYETLKPLREAP
jgi:sugar (pentulose or hexulose) kinase